MADNELITYLGVDLDDFKKGMQEAQQVTEKTATKVETDFGKVGKSFEKIGKQMTTIGKDLTASVTAPIVGVGAAAVLSYQSYDDCMDKMRASTGLTGESLDKMGETLKKAYTTGQQPMDETADAMALIYQRTGETGQGLEDMTVKMGNLAKLTETDFNTTVEDTTKLFSAWKLSTGDQSKYLDTLFKVSQQSGMGIDQLSSVVGDNALMFQSMGYSVDEATVLIGSLNKQGLDASDVINAMGLATRKLATDQSTAAQQLKDGKITQEEYNKLMGETTETYLAGYIDKIKNAKDANEANRLAVEAFGPKGTEFAKIIRDGGMDVGEMTKKLNDNRDSIKGATDDTKGLNEKMEEMKKRLETSLIPLGEKVVDILVDMEPTITKIIDGITVLLEWFDKLDPTLQTIIIAFLALVAAVGPLLVVLGSVISAVGTIIGMFGAGGLLAGLGAVIGPILLVVAALGVLVVAFLWLYDNVKWFRDGVNVQIEAIKTNIQVFVDIVSGMLHALADFLNGDFSGAWEAVGGTVKKVFQDIVDYLFKVGIAQAVANIINSVVDKLNWAIEQYNKLPKAVQILGQINPMGHVTLTSSSGQSTGNQGGQGGCFIDGTMITMADGTCKPVEAIQINDSVRTYNPETMEYMAGRVTSLLTRTADVTYRLILQDNTQVECSGEHPFLMLHVPKGVPTMHDGRYVRADQLRIGYKLVKESGEVQIKGIVKEQRPIRVHNFNVEPCHTYIANGILVHNRKTQFAEGGIFNQPTFLTDALIGERQPEAILPIAPLMDAIRNGGGEREITIRVPVSLDGRAVAEIVTKAIIQKNGSIKGVGF